MGSLFFLIQGRPCHPEWLGQLKKVRKPLLLQTSFIVPDDGRKVRKAAGEEVHTLTEGLQGSSCLQG